MAETKSSMKQDKPEQDKADLTSTASSVRFRKLPERILPEDMVTTQDTEAPPEPTMGRDTDRDFLLRNAGF